MKKRSGPPRLKRLQPWAGSPENLAALVRARALLRKRRQEGPFCGAIRRYDGEPCRNFPLDNGRCRYHGGLVPKGKAWHRVQPADNPKRSLAKLEEVERRKERQRRRVARMTPEERQAHAAWKAAHDPDPRKRWERRIALEARELLGVPPASRRRKEQDE